MTELEAILFEAGIGQDHLARYRIKSLMMEIVGDDPRLRLKVEML